jgi:stage V sporulation protein SpoVS
MTTLITARSVFILTPQESRAIHPEQSTAQDRQEAQAKNHVEEGIISLRNHVQAVAVARLGILAQDSIHIDMYFIPAFADIHRITAAGCMGTRATCMATRSGSTVHW